MAEQMAQDARQAVGDVSKEVADAFSNISNYIPTEIMGAYIPVLSVFAAASLQSFRWILFLAFVILTPIASWVLFAVAAVEAKEAIPWNPRYWPAWGMLAAVVAFTAYAAALPGSVFHEMKWFSDALGLGGLIFAGLVLHLGTQVSNIIHRAKNGGATAGSSLATDAAG
jgi:hypothetical protein